MLAVTASGKKLKPYVIFKRKTLPRIRVPPAPATASTEAATEAEISATEGDEGLEMPAAEVLAGLAASRWTDDFDWDDITSDDEDAEVWHAGEDHDEDDDRD
ncbi:hypothetical protein CLOM_g9154 [Closterium sp. NIES-68]|nr:hypothetical protein CLOM_g9154 [Closterium sp. NIES-68]GJP62141.1 hypothetical protein CLOP_g19234 [Closterium sp. NIES-67]